jgi:hypothetical protein
VTTDENRALQDLAIEVAKSTAKQEQWAEHHDARLSQIEENQRITNSGLQAIGKEVAILQGRGVERDKRISNEAERVDVLERRLRRQEDTGVHHVGELKGVEKAREATRKGFLFAFAVLGALGVVGGIVFGILKLTGCGG